MRGTARGWIAIGDIAHGIAIAIGGVAVGGIALGAIPIGFISFGGFAVGAAACGGIAVGGIACGIASIGYIAFGAFLGLGFEAAYGFVAVAKHFAFGALVGVADHVRDNAFRNWSDTNPVMRVISNISSILWWVPFLMGPLLSGIATNWLVRHRSSK